MSSSQGFAEHTGGGSKSSASSSSSTGTAKKAAFTFQSRGRPSDPPTSKSRPLARRPHQLGHDDDSSDEERAPTHEEILGFDTHTGGQITADGKAVSDANQPLVIPVTSKNNWRDRPGTNVRKSKKNLLPREVQAMQEAQKNGQAPAGGAVETEGPSMAYGLSFAQKPSEQDEEIPTVKEDQPMHHVQPISTEDQKPLTEDQLAMQALLKETTGEVERRTDLVIESSKHDEDEEPFRRHDETSSFRTDVAARPESATLDQYNAIPVEEFGAALLRGMGWKDGQSIGRGDYSSSTAAQKAKNPTGPGRRPGFLGIGAKDSGKGAEVELGAWGKSAMRKASRKQSEENASGNVEGVYMPVTMRNKKTGEYITEEELAELKESSKSQVEKDDWRERRDRNLEKSGRDRDQDREYRKRDYDDDRSDRRNGSSRRDRSSSASRHSSRRSKYDDDDDHRREDRSPRDRDQERERDRERRRDRDGDRDYRKDRDRERDRDRKYRDDRYSSSRHSSHSSRNDRNRDRDSRRSRRDD